MNTIPIIRKIKNRNFDQLDLRDDSVFLDLLCFTDELLAMNSDVRDFLKIEKKMAKSEYSLFSHLAIKSAISKLYVLQLKENVRLDIVVPLYHEGERLAARQDKQVFRYNNPLMPNTYGENELLRKITEIEWLTRDTKLSYKMVFVDDICDKNSGKYAKKIIQHNKLQNTCSVLFLGKELKNTDTESIRYKSIESVIKNGGNSIRGGALCLGFANLLENYTEKDFENNYISYVDADTSYSLTQVGIPLHLLIDGDNHLAITANRKHELSQIDRNESGTITSRRSTGLIRMKQTIGFIRKHILSHKVPYDTQSGFKFFKPNPLLELITSENKSTNFSFDTQLLSRLADKYDHYEKPIETFGVVLIDSDELSTANNEETYFLALKILVELLDESKKSINLELEQLLRFLTFSYENYILGVSLLEDTVSISELHLTNSETFRNIQNLREQIQTNLDSTAVGDYYHSGIINQFLNILANMM